MSYHLKRKESVGKAVRRLGCHRVAHARKCLARAADAETIHGVRKDIKKARALVRLVRPGLRRKDFATLRTLFHDVADKLAGSRDAYVKTETLRKLESRFKRQLAPHSLQFVKSDLRRDSDVEMKRCKEGKSARELERLLNRMEKRIDRLTLRSEGWTAVGPGLKKCYRASRNAYFAARKNPTFENLHQWRKRAKDLGYDLKFLNRMASDEMRSMTDEIDTLTDLLGDHHDLGVLRDALRQCAIADRKPRLVKSINSVIDRRQKQLRTAALEIGARSYGEKPSRLCVRWRRYWNTWKGRRTPRRPRHASPRS